MKFKTLAWVAALTLLALPVAAQATLVDYTFTVTKPLMHGTDILGGSVTPVIFQFRIDSEAPNINAPSTTNAVYPINDFGVSGFGKVSIGSEVTFLQGGLIAIQESPSGSGLTAITSGEFSENQIGGRSLFMSFAHIFDWSGQMLSDIGLPLNDTFASEANFGMFRLAFRPNPLDPEFQTGDWIYYDAFPINQGDFTLTRTVYDVVPEPTSIVMMLVALGSFGFSLGREIKEKPLE